MLSALLLLPLLAIASPVKRAMVPHEHLSAIPFGFSHVSGAPSEQLLTLRIALAPNNMPGLQNALMAVSTPGNAQYGQFLTQDEVNAFVRPTAATTAAVNLWLAENHVIANTISPAGDWLEFEIPAEKANSLFEADFSVFRHDDTGTQAVRTLSYSLPSDLSNNVLVLHPATSFWNPESAPTFSARTAPNPKMARQTTIPASCDDTITPVCLEDLYNIPTTPAKQASNHLAVSGFIQQFANNADLQQFLTAQRPDLVGETFILQTLDNGMNPQNISEAGIEANLDIQYTIGLASRVPTNFVSVGNDSTDGLSGFLDIVNFFLKEENPPHTFTTSYGQDEDTVSVPLAVSLCNAYAALGARGTSILFASGDGAVAGSRQKNCTNFVPTFPSGCPFLTSVGATQDIPETSAPFSSGGFSDVFLQPPYQALAVDGFLRQLGTTNEGLFNKTGRAYPDVSAMGNNVLITFRTEVGTVGGTSCSSPITASVIALINDRLIAEHRPPLGFLNPFVYLNSEAFTDITTGNNPGCGTDGFPAVKGWDPVTGVGTPNFSKLAAVLLLPD